jgi:hypothetical protein
LLNPPEVDTFDFDPLFVELVCFFGATDLHISNSLLSSSVSKRPDLISPFISVGSGKYDKSLYFKG